MKKTLTVLLTLCLAMGLFSSTVSAGLTLQGSTYDVNTISDVYYYTVKSDGITTRALDATSTDDEDLLHFDDRQTLDMEVDFNFSDIEGVINTIVANDGSSPFAVFGSTIVNYIHDFAKDAVIRAEITLTYTINDPRITVNASKLAYLQANTEELFGDGSDPSSALYRAMFNVTTLTYNSATNTITVICETDPAYNGTGVLGKHVLPDPYPTSSDPTGNNPDSHAEDLKNLNIYLEEILDVDPSLYTDTAQLVPATLDQVAVVELDTAPGGYNYFINLVKGADPYVAKVIMNFNDNGNAVKSVPIAVAGSSYTAYYRDMDNNDLAAAYSTTGTAGAAFTVTDPGFAPKVLKCYSTTPLASPVDCSLGTAGTPSGTFASGVNYIYYLYYDDPAPTVTTPAATTPAPTGVPDGLSLYATMLALASAILLLTKRKKEEN